MSIYGWLQAGVFFALVWLLTKPLGVYMTRVFSGERTLLSPVLAPVENIFYRLCRIDPKREMNATNYLFAIFAFSAVGLIYLYAQNGSSFSASSLSGLYAVGNLPGSTSNAGLAIGTVTSDGSSNLSGDVALISFGDNNVGSATATYTVAANGRGVATGGSGSLFGNYVFYIVSPSLSVGMDVTSGDSAPSIQTLQQ